MKYQVGLRIERLEGRNLPAQFGVPWADPNVTLSFVPDGTSIDGVPSVLSQTFAADGIPDAAWKSEILRAAQTWLQNANLNVGVVADDGSPSDVAGLPQHDPRFGDIRISGRPLSPDVLAITVPPGPAGGARAGDIIINTAQPFSVGGGNGTYDLYSAILQEVGHAFGMSNSTDINSPMFEQYQGLRTGITAGDNANIIALYGPRAAATSAASFAPATELAVPPALVASVAQTIVEDSDISTNSQVDFYTFSVPLNAAGSIAVRFETSGLSLLEGDFSVFSSSGSVRDHEAASSPLAGDLTATLSNVTAGQTYYVRVARATPDGGNPFGIGRYRLEIDFNPTSPNTPDTIADLLLSDGHTNDSAATAATLTPDPVNDGFFAADGRFDDQSDIDFYGLTIPAAATIAVGPATLTVTVRSAQPGDGLKPLATVLDANQNPVPATVVRSAGGEYTIQAAVTPGQSYFIATGADPAGQITVGDYHLDVNTQTAATPLTTFESGTLTSNNAVAFSTLVVIHGSVMDFVLGNSGSAAGVAAGSRLTVFDANNHVVLDLLARSYEAASAAKFLPPGTYILRLTGLTVTPGDPLPDIPFTVQGFNLSDPIGPGGDNPDTGNDYETQQDPEEMYELDYDDPGIPIW